MSEKEPKPKRRRWLPIIGALVIGCVVMAILAVVFGSPDTDTEATPSQAVASQPTSAEETAPPPSTPEPTRAPTEPPSPTDTPLPTDTPAPTDTPIPVEPVVFVEWQGSGEAVSDNFEAPACYKAVFSWSAQPNDAGLASLIVHLLRADIDRDVSLINEIGMDRTEPLTGEVVEPLDSASYYLTTENISGPWTVTGTCFDGVAPVGSDIGLQGSGNRVSENFSLPDCRKSVFLWSVEPNSSGVASLIVHLYSAPTERDTNLVNAFEMDQTQVLTGETLEATSEGIYFLSTANSSGPWTVTWECRD